jgi:hypothetical protein
MHSDDQNFGFFGHREFLTQHFSIRKGFLRLATHASVPLLDFGFHLFIKLSSVNSPTNAI